MPTFKAVVFFSDNTTLELPHCLSIRSFTPPSRIELDEATAEGVVRWAVPFSVVAYVTKNGRRQIIPLMKGR